MLYIFIIVISFHYLFVYNFYLICCLVPAYGYIKFGIWNATIAKLDYSTNSYDLEIYVLDVYDCNNWETSPDQYP